MPDRIPLAETPDESSIENTTGKPSISITATGFRKNDAEPDDDTNSESRDDETSHDDEAKEQGIGAGRRKSTVGRVVEFAIEKSLFICASLSVIFVFFIFYFLFEEARHLFDHTTLWDFLTGEKWDPVGQNPEEKKYFGAKPLIIGSLLVTLGAMLFAIPLGIGSAIYISELAPSRIKDTLKTGTELLAGIPSVVYGLFGLLIIVKWIHISFDNPSGECVLAGSILLGIMSLPMIISVAEDAISSVPKELKEGSLALGATKWQTISNVTIPSAISGITAAVILGFGLAVGETMAVMMVTGNAAIIPNPLTDVFSPVKTLTGTLAIEMGEAYLDSPHYYALFMVAVTLFVIVLAINSTALWIMKKIKEKHYGRSGEEKKPLFSFTGFSRLTGFRPGIFSLPDNVKRRVDEIRKHSGEMRGVVLSIVMIWLLTSWFGGRGILIFFAILAVFLGSRKLDPKKYQVFAVSLVTSCMIAVIFLLGTLLFYIVSEGLPALSWEFLTEPPDDVGRTGGIYPAIVGTIYLTLGAIAIAMPLGVGAGIYMADYAKESAGLRIIRAGIDNLNGTPSIVFGLFGYAFLVLYLDMGRSLLAGQIKLAMMVLPTVIRTTEEAMKAVPHSMREGSLALGATKWETTRRVVVPPAAPGIITGIILSIGRAAGETAPIMFTAAVFSQRYLPEDIMHPVMALPYYILMMALNVPGGEENAAGAALVLMMLVLSFNLAAAIIRKRFQIRLKGFR